MFDKVVQKAYNIIMSENEKDIIIFDKEEVWEWLQIGIDKGWVTEPFCYTHDGDPYMTEEEQQEWEDGGDPCAPVLKILV
jgi:hypothetical protein